MSGTDSPGWWGTVAKIHEVYKEIILTNKNMEDLKEEQAKLHGKLEAMTRLLDELVVRTKASEIEVEKCLDLRDRVTKLETIEKEAFQRAQMIVFERSAEKVVRDLLEEKLRSNVGTSKQLGPGGDSA